MNITLNNTSSANIDFNPSQSQIQDSNGVLTKPMIMSEMPDNLSSASLAPGGKLTGNLLFEAPQGDPGLKLVYQATLLRASESVTVRLP